ncbi:MAG: hypothetical protein HC802_23415 [Caldilineaceae bacterium]|nr:hypothetical protein [Caldilineaceae bacterium]
MSHVNVRSIQTLRELKAGLARFGAESRSALQRMEMELRSTQEWLVERQHFWEGQTRRCQEAVRTAQMALARCQSNVQRDPRTGRVYASDCSGPQQILRQAQARLQETQTQLANVQRWARSVDEAALAFRRQARRMNGLVDKKLVEAEVFLERRAASLEGYAAIGLPGLALQTISPIQAAGNTVTTGLILGTMGLTAAALAVIRWMAGPLRQTLGDSSEALTARLLSEQSGWQEMPFDQPKHGFDRLFIAPGLPIIVVESKVHGRGEFRPGQTQSGEQGSPGWIAAQVAKMAKPCFGPV